MNILCPHFGPCPGCQHNTNVDQILLLKKARAFFSEHGINDLPLNYDLPTGWRCRAKLAVRGTSSDPQIGLFEEGTHKVLDIPLCRIHHPSINKACDALRRWIQQHHIEPYNESNGKGLLRYVQMTVQRTSGSVQLALVVNCPSGADRDIPMESLWKAQPDLWHSIWRNFNTRRDNVIFGKEWGRAFGEEWLWDRFSGIDVCFHPASFFQANPSMFERLIDKVKDCVPRGANVVEFYAGAGAIGLALAERCEAVACTEVVPLAGECFAESLRRLPLEQQKKLTYKVAEAKEVLGLLKGSVDVVIADPPRKGLDPALLEAMNQADNVKTFVYVSCGWDSFERDCSMLVRAGWQLSEAEAFLFFPGGEHLEILGLFQR